LRRHWEVPDEVHVPIRPRTIWAPAWVGVAKDNAFGQMNVLISILRIRLKRSDKMHLTVLIQYKAFSSVFAPD